MDYSFAKRYLKYKLFSHHKGGHGIHSPFVYHLLTEVMEKRKNEPEFAVINELRRSLLLRSDRVKQVDLGAGTRLAGKNQNQISKIAKNAAIKKQYGELLFRLVRHFQPKTILELGTSLGLSTCYLSLAAPSSKLTTIEGCPHLCKIAKESFAALDLKNIETINMDFKVVLPVVLDAINTVDVVFFDGNHQYDATIHYFEQVLKHKHNDSVFIFDDINWSEGMLAAWEYIKKHPEVTATINIFQLGIVFFRREMKKQEFVIRF